jgi:hypothetical protein
MSAIPVNPSLWPKDRQVWVPLSSVQESPENELLYRPIRPDDPEIQELAASIKKRGLLEPIVITRDRYILSGHRRYAACKLNGMRTIACRVEDMRHDDPGFVARLREHNIQRVKTIEEVVREKVVFRDPAEAHRALVEHKRAKGAVSGEFLKIEGMKTRHGISKGKEEMLRRAVTIVREQRKHWPLSDRSIHYDMLNEPPLRHSKKPGSRYRNDRVCYQDLCDLLTRARLAGMIPFQAIADPTRTVCSWDLDREAGSFVKRQMDEFLVGYCRDYQQSQPNHIEIVGEKNTIAGSIRPVAMEYCVPYTLGRGYCSIDPRYKMSQRFEASGKGKLIVLILSDFDPEGEDIAHSFARSMRDDFGVAEIVARKVCLTYEQVLERDLPQTFDMKTEGKRHKKFKEKYGDRVHELEALPPDERSRLLSEAILEVMDIDAYNRELDAEAEDAALIESIREKMTVAMAVALDAKTEGRP